MPNIVLDSNVAIALAIALPYTEPAKEQMRVWVQESDNLFGPALWGYEIVSTLRKLIASNVISPNEADEATKLIFDLNIEIIPWREQKPTDILAWANRLGQGQAYDAAYLALADQLKAEFWTADKRLVNRAKQLGLANVYLIG